MPPSCCSGVENGKTPAVLLKQPAFLFIEKFFEKRYLENKVREQYRAPRF